MNEFFSFSAAMPGGAVRGSMRHRQWKYTGNRPAWPAHQFHYVVKAVPRDDETKVARHGNYAVKFLMPPLCTSCGLQDMKVYVFDNGTLCGGCARAYSQQKLAKLP